MEDKVNSLKRVKTVQKGKIAWLETYIQSITEPISEEKLPELNLKIENTKNIMKCVEDHPSVYLLKQDSGMVEYIHLI